MRPLRCSASSMQSKMAIELALARYFELATHPDPFKKS